MRFQGLNFCQPNRAFVCNGSLDHRDVHANTMSPHCRTAISAIARDRGPRSKGFGAMRLIKLIAIGLLAWPAVEIVAFVCVSAAVGFVNAVLLLLLMSFAGLFVLRHFSGDVTRLRAAGARGIAAAPLDRRGMAPGLVGILLFIPGFVTTVLGLVVLFPLSRRWLLAGCRRVFAAGPGRTHPGIIDLAPDEWRPLPGPRLPPTRPTSGPFEK
jgi:UPF0716 protein FxsA